MSSAHDSDPEQARIILGLLELVERDEGVSQRRLAADLGIALGLVNAYLKRCVKKGLVKVSEAPARRYLYYLTPHGFAEKSRLTAEYLSYSFSFFRIARADCVEALAQARSRGCKRIALAGISDLAEIAMICALEAKIEVIGVFQADAAEEGFLGLPVLHATTLAIAECDGVLLTDLRNPSDTLDRLIDRFGSDGVFVPALLTSRIRRTSGTVKQPEAVP